MNTKQMLETNKIDALWVTNHYNKRYFSEFSGSTSEVIIANDKNYFITDGRYMTKVADEIDHDKFEVIIIESNMGYIDEVVRILGNYNVIGFESSTMTVDKFEAMSALLPDKEIVKVSGAIEEMRLCKNDDEVAKIKKAVEITDKVFDYVCENIKVGMSEIEVKLMIENQHILLGAEAQSFEAIVASGTNGALPHAVPSTKLIEEGDMVTIDFGCQVDGYCSDMTRSFVMGAPRDEEMVKIHDIVNEAAQMQIAAVKAGKTCFEIDKIGRDYIAEQGYGDKFIHGTGHGVGLEVHEAPVVTYLSKEVLAPGHIITIEPGIYVEGLGGVRIEFDLLVTEDGHEVLNQSPYNWDIVNQVQGK